MAMLPNETAELSRAVGRQRRGRRADEGQHSTGGCNAGQAYGSMGRRLSGRLWVEGQRVVAPVHGKMHHLSPRQCHVHRILRLPLGGRSLQVREPGHRAEDGDTGWEGWRWVEVGGGGWRWVEVGFQGGSRGDPKRIINNFDCLNSS